ncbi:hypothetical protein D7X88_07885 [bacterium C-53]|nr:hypothetical protein [Lachnospiraceae bacterium]NBI02026.1 hypothetical protein [Lachnospiraceae bacterium]RKJ10295.1 hypothetical protein D7X88_07885 [bacterium C-53]
MWALRRAFLTVKDIKVWNLSLDSKLEIKPNFISPEAAELDRIQSEYDVIFEMNGVNRMDDFIKMCMARGWLVNQLDIENQMDIYAKAEEDIVFES